MIAKSTFQFLTQLSGNNNREWFAKHKQDYEAAKANVEDFVAQLIEGSTGFDPKLGDLQAKKCLFRIYRDVRFSKDKSPYKAHFGVWLAPSGKNSGGPGYYLNIQPSATFLAGGYWMPDVNHLKAIRQEIDYNIIGLNTILTAKDFVANFKGLDTEHALKTAPQGYPKDHENIALLRLKSFTVTRKLTDELLCAENAAKQIVEIWKSIYPLNKFLERAVE